MNPGIALLRESDARIEATWCAQHLVPLFIPLFRYRPLSLDPHLDLSHFTHLLLTSRRAAAAVAHLPRPPFPVLCVGPATAEPIAHWKPLVAPESTGAAAVHSLALTPSDRVLFPRGERVHPGTLAALEATGAALHDPVVYESSPDPSAERTFRDAFPLDAVTVWSPAGVERWAQLTNSALPLVAIGPSTAAAARGCGLSVSAVADSPHRLLEAVLSLDAIQAIRCNRGRNATAQ